MEMQSCSMRSPERRVLGMLNSNTYSPTSNLHLLTSVASELSDLAQREQPIQDQSKSSNGQRPVFKPRKDKSLGILCDKFLAMFPINLDACPSVEINLDKVSMELGIVKRRIYDIINILESLHMTSRIAKNRYEWYGDRNLKAALSHLRKLALKYGWEQKIQEFKQQHQPVQLSKCCNSSGACSIDYCDDCEKNMGSPTRSNDDILHEERTLGIMCQKFIMLFLVTEEGEMLNLDLATQMLVTTSVRPSFTEAACHERVTHQLCCHPRLKTKIRRLYDIANVLISLGLIRKEWLTVSSLRKHGFVYSGPTVPTVPTVEDTTESVRPDSHGSHTMRNSLLMVPVDEHGDRTVIYSQSKRLSRKRKDDSCNGPAEKQPLLPSRESSEAMPAVTRLGSFEDILLVAEQELKLLSQEPQNGSSPPLLTSQDDSDRPDKESPSDQSVSRPVCVAEALSAHNYAATLPMLPYDDSPAQTTENTVTIEESPAESDCKTETTTKDEPGNTNPTTTPCADPEVRFTVTRTLAPSNIVVRKLNSKDLRVTIHHARGGSFIRLQPVGSSQKLALPVTCIKTLKPTNISVLRGPQGPLESVGLTRRLEVKEAVNLVPIRSVCEGESQP